MGTHSLTIEVYWGFKNGFHRAGEALVRGAPVTLSDEVIVAANNTTAKDAVYIVDYVRREDFRYNETYGDINAIAENEYAILLNISEGYFTISSDHFSEKPSVGDKICVNSAGQYAVVSGPETVVAKVINVNEFSDDTYEVTIGPVYS